MAFTRKHYKAIAAIIKGNLNHTWHKGATPDDAVRSIAFALASYFSRDNINFNYGRFYHACGMKEE